jgi:FkbM family methyltransferase
VVEANPYIIPVLEKNKKINNCHFTIVNRALAYEKNVDYYVSKNPVDSGLYKKTPQKVSIQGTTLQELSTGFDRINLLVDIEGAEVDLIDHEIELISQKVSTLIIEFHPLLTAEAEIERVISKLEKAGLHCKEKVEHDAIFINTSH